MKSQKFILQSKTFWSAILTLAIAIMPKILECLEQGVSGDNLGEIIALTCTTVWTLYNRYNARASLYTPSGLPGRDYISPTDNY